MGITSKMLTSHDYAARLKLPQNPRQQLLGCLLNQAILLLLVMVLLLSSVVLRSTLTLWRYVRWPSSEVDKYASGVRLDSILKIKLPT